MPEEMTLVVMMLLAAVRDAKGNLGPDDRDIGDLYQRVCDIAGSDEGAALTIVRTSAALLSHACTNQNIDAEEWLQSLALNDLEL
ncbi:hypothetical protein BH09ACT10_BH09ACT10_10180 [soil metagenome]